MPVASEEEGLAMTEEEGMKVPRIGPHPHPVRRCLFGEVDHEANRRDTIRIREDLAVVSKRKWNFDFENGCPLEGQYLWRSVQREGPRVPSSTTGSSYTPLADCSPSGEGLVGCVNFELGLAPLDSTLSSDSATGTRCRMNDKAEDSREHMAAKTHRRQSSLKKYFRVKKRSANKLQISK